jgi:hypothetical protein
MPVRARGACSTDWTACVAVAAGAAEIIEVFGSRRYLGGMTYENTFSATSRRSRARMTFHDEGAAILAADAEAAAHPERDTPQAIAARVKRAEEFKRRYVAAHELNQPAPEAAEEKPLTPEGEAAFRHFWRQFESDQIGPFERDRARGSLRASIKRGGHIELRSGAMHIHTPYTADVMDAAMQTAKAFWPQGVVMDDWASPLRSATAWACLRNGVQFEGQRLEAPKAYDPSKWSVCATTGRVYRFDILHYEWYQGDLKAGRITGDLATVNNPFAKPPAGVQAERISAARAPTAKAKAALPA